MSNSEICEIPLTTKEIIKKAKSQNSNPVFSKFAERFLSYIPIDYTIKNDDKIFVDLTNKAFDFYKTRIGDENKIAVEKTAHGTSPAITILLLSDDKPFIIDSISALLTKRGVKPKFIMHPIITSKRDKSGNVFSIESDGRNESIVVVKILGNFTEENINEIREEFIHIYQRINIVQNSRVLLQERVDKITSNLENIQDNPLLRQNSNAKLAEDINEAIALLEWIKNNNFTFLSIGEFDLKGKILDSIGLDEILLDAQIQSSNIISNILSKDNVNNVAFLGKIYCDVVIRERRSVDLVVLKHFDDKLQCKKITLICGIYSPAIYHQSIKNIPLLRRKMHHTLGKSGFSNDGYNLKKTKDIIESMPRAALIQLESEVLYCMCLHMLSSMLTHRSKTFIQKKSGKYINILIFLPKINATPETYNSILQYLQEQFIGKLLYQDITEVGQNFSYIFFTIKSDHDVEYDDAKIDRDIRNIARSWDEDFHQKLIDLHGEYNAGQEYNLYRNIFPPDYKHRFTPKIAIVDLEYLVKTSEHELPEFNINKKSNSEYIIKVYSKEEKLPLSNILPLVENMGFKAINEQSFLITESSAIKNCWLHSINLILPNGFDGDFADLKLKIEEALNKMSNHELAVDVLANLITLCSFDWRRVKLLKALTRYLHQTCFLYGKEYVQQSMVKHHQFSDLLVQLFNCRFSLEKTKNRKKNIEKINQEIKDALFLVKDNVADKILRSMWDLVNAITRTNFFQNRDYFSFKIDSAKISHLPSPVPFTEIFVYSSKFEGIYLSGGKVARGGLRWSNRTEDYRTEVLGLMKAQMTKNPVIVPVGSKGGFVIEEDLSAMTYEQSLDIAIKCYKNFLRGMLDIVDNMQEGNLKPPAKEVVCYDDPYPYLVVAADKGTASFSDYANTVAQEYNFWLSDAFASGGSAGYDHKKMGITAKGAWLGAAHHFYKLGVDPCADIIKVVGIGDMSGDVFGNGMLLSKSIHLIAAFDHRDIFIDPLPDAKTSYHERERLFKLPRSSWQDYDASLISKGGGVFSRKSKSIKISPEIKEVLNLRIDEITPDALIRAIIQSKVDLIWNGGIGTYIKASSESNNDIGDRSNDALRCDAKDIKAKIIAEGGNLGISQLGRVEYSKNGNFVNTDFIDNAGGVSCSDREVNIKIALGEAVKSGKITIKQRNKLMLEMTQQVEKLVLNDIHEQMQALTITEFLPSSNLDTLCRLIHFLENKKLLNREVEFLPSDEEIQQISASGKGLTRPELAVLLSYSKMSIHQEILSAKLLDEKWFNSYLINYFPELMQEKFKNEILAHPLRREIISTIVTSKIVNQVGGALIYTIQREIGGSICDIIRAYIITCHIFDLDSLWAQAKKISNDVKFSIRMKIFTNLVKMMRRGISWIIKNIDRPIDIEGNINKLHDFAKEISQNIPNLLYSTNKNRFNKNVSELTHFDIDPAFAQNIASLEHMVSIFDIVNIMDKSKKPLTDIAKNYFILGDKLMLDELRKYCDSLMEGDYWDRLSMQAIKDDIYEKQRKLMVYVENLDADEKIDAWFSENKVHIDSFIRFVNQIKQGCNINNSMMILANKKLSILLHKVELTSKKP